MFLQQFIPTHRLLVGGITTFCDAIAIMYLLGTVQAYPYGKALRCQKAAPVLIEKGAVGLYGISDASVWGPMLALQRYKLPKVFQP